MNKIVRSFYIPEPLLKEIERLAAAEDRSVNNWVNKQLSKAVAGLPKARSTTKSAA